MEKEYQIQVYSPTKCLVDAQVSEAVLPSHDGEVGVLAGHEDYLGLLGTGVFKIVRGGDDYWYMLSSGVWEVKSGKLVVLAQTAEEIKDLDLAAMNAKLKDLEAALAGKSSMSDEYQALKLEADRVRARLEAHRRVHMN